MKSESSYNADELGQYRSLSTSTVIALVLGLASPVAFVSPLLQVVPLAAAAVALWALAKIRSLQGGLSGARLAYFGLALAIVFGVAAATRVQVRIELLRRQADSAAQHWLSLLAQGHSEEAQGLMTASAISGLGTPDNDDGTAPIFTAALNSAQLLQDPLSRALIDMRKSDELEITLREAKVAQELAKPRAVLTYRASNSRIGQLLFTLSLLKSEGFDRESTWLMDGWQTGEISLPGADGK